MSNLNSQHSDGLQGNKIQCCSPLTRNPDHDSDLSVVIHDQDNSGIGCIYDSDKEICQCYE